MMPSISPARAINARGISMQPALRSAVLASALLAAGMGGSDAWAETFPERTIEVVVPFAPGGVTDVLGRVLAQGMAKALSSPVAVVNKAGAAGTLGAAFIAHAKPDGYSLLLTAGSTMAPTLALTPQPGYDRASFEPICQAFRFDLVIIVRPSSPLRSMSDLIAAARRMPGKVSYGHIGFGTSFHLAMVALSRSANVEFNPIPFRGDAETMQQVLSGQIDFGIVTLSSAAGGQFRFLGLFADGRNASIPEVPTMSEQGLQIADVDAMNIGGLFAPAGVVTAVKRRLGNACRAAAAGTEYRSRAKTLHQPEDYYADALGFADNVNRAVEVKNRLIATLAKENGD
jgi:tripartite-type tricarboxylate transporter receptor subunit TctC